MSRRVLVIDDEEPVRTSVQTCLTNENFIVDVAAGWYPTEDLPGANELVLKYDYDVVFVDIIMPKLNGIEVLKRIKAIRKNTVVVMLTGLSDSKTTADAFKNNAYDYITKPLTSRTIIQAAFHGSQAKQREDERDSLKKEIDEHEQRNKETQKQLEKTIQYQAQLIDQTVKTNKVSTTLTDASPKLKNIADELALYSQKQRDELDLIKKMLSNAMDISAPS